MSSPPSTTKGVAGRTNYEAWDKKTSTLLKELEREEDREQQDAKEALGLDGKYATSEAEATERAKALKLKDTKQKLQNYQDRESQLIHTLEHLDFSNKDKHTYTITKNDIESGRRLLNITNLTGPGTIVLSQDLSLLENIIPTNTALTPKQYAEDAENECAPNTNKTTTILGLIKVTMSHLSNCKVIVKCKILTGLIELSYCKNVTLCVEKGATASTIQADLCEGLKLEFHDASSMSSSSWGDSQTDRIYHAGVKDMSVKIYKQESLTMAKEEIDYLKDGAKAIGNASAEEVQFITSVVNQQLITERIVQNSNNGTKSVPMTERERINHQKKKQEVQNSMEEHVKKSVKFITKNGTKEDFVSSSSALDNIMEEVYTDTAKLDVEAIKEECEMQKKKGNEAFSSGEYAQAVLFYTLGLDKVAELQSTTNSANLDDVAPILYSNRAACFLKLGHHEKALDDTNKSIQLNPTYVKAIFRKGLALHAMKRYSEAMPVLAQAHKIEPKNKQIKQALQFAEIGHTKEMRERMNR